MSYCPNCGKELNQEENFCSSCGKPIKSENSMKIDKSHDKSIFYKYTTRDIILFSSSIILLFLAIIIYSLHNGPITTGNGIFWTIVSAILAWFSVKSNQYSDSLAKVSNIKELGNFFIGALYFISGSFLDTLYLIVALVISLFFFITYLNIINKITPQNRSTSERILFPITWVFIALIALTAFGCLIKLAID